ncbi:hypothetical protein E2C01_039379 [Portunus trituberculatus]|uniref:Uncharacterized protein n=1 Tax=Portunus trituberculatus TaxID=210409 RepID=A0A5B7FKJ5_PORTR|nr:hypothetical protein [Portunus trituberculatus]
MSRTIPFPSTLTPDITTAQTPRHHFAQTQTLFHT